MERIFSMKQLEDILSRFDLDSQKVLPEIARKVEPDLKRKWVEQLEIELWPEGSDIKIKISGLYCQVYACGYKDAGLWQPSSPTVERFEYETILK